MPISWNEIKTRAAAFVKDWENTEREEADAKPFLIEFLNVFGLTQRKIATFEHRVKKLNEADGYIDLLWKGMLLVEMKSRGKDLDKAYQQAKEYCHGLKDHELPQLIMVSDFEHVVVYDVSGTITRFLLKDLIKHIQVFGPLAGYQKREYKEQDPVNLQAAELMGKLHDQLKAIGYTGHDLEVYLVRLLFCLFADDTSIFEKDIFDDYLRLKTAPDGSDLAMHMDSLFNVLNTPPEKRLTNLDEALAAFPYVNGKLFEERLMPASFDSTMRQTLVDCCRLDWGKISPAIFGSLFQSVMDEKARRNLGAHYTNEKNILKLIKPLFLDELWADYEKARNSKIQLQKLHERLSSLRFLDPACGCGNFLIIAYREIRLLEIEIIKQLLKLQGFREEVIREARMDASYLIKCNVDQFYGIEYEEFPAQIARTAMWLMDHQMNMLVTETFGEYYVRLPLKKAATIVHGNALRIDWQSLIDPLPFEKGEGCYDYILGNPPFRGHHLQTEEQKADLHRVLFDIQAAGVMDYVSAWYYKSSEYLTRNSKQIKVGFVSTNSITQGEQVGILWSVLLNKFKIKIHFAHRTFKWTNEAKDAAAVYCVIIGFSNFDVNQKRLFEYETVKSEPHETPAKNINPYLVDYKDILISNRTNPICDVPKMQYGSKPSDGGYFLLNEDEKDELLKKEPNAIKFIKKFISGREFLYNENRYCLWLVKANPDEIRSMPEIMKRIQLVKEFRQKSTAKTTREYPHHTLFRQVTQPESDYIIFPSTTSETRKYLPLGFLSKEIIISNASYAIPNASLYDFGVLCSLMQMSWMRYTCGRLKSDYRYSNTIVYNNFPWPLSPTDKQKEAVEKAAQGVLDARALFPESSLADLYDPNTMPPALVKAHQQLDKAVDLCYRPQPFPNETKRIEYLFELYDQYTAGLFAGEKKGKKKMK